MPWGVIAIAATLLAGCFSPAFTGEIRCADGLCPTGFVCDDGLCRDELGVTADASIDSETPPDAAIDSGPVCATLTFRDNQNGYDDTDDTTLREDIPNLNLGNEETVEWDDENTGTGGGQDFGLLRFNAVFGPGADQVPMGAEIVSATLNAVVVEAGDGGPGEIRETAVAWNENTTFNTFGGNPGVQGSDFGDRVDDAPTDAGVATIDVTTSTTRGSAAGQMPGWIFIPENNNTSGVQLASSEDPTVGNRPQLEISFCD